MEYIPCAHKTWPITNHMATPQCTRDVKRSPLALQPLPVKNLDYGRGSRFGRPICTGCNIFFHISIQKSNIIYWFASLFLHWLETVLLSYAHVYITPPVYGALLPDPRHTIWIVCYVLWEIQRNFHHIFTFILQSMLILDTIRKYSFIFPSLFPHWMKRYTFCLFHQVF